ncbi:MAG: hypothetical protein KBS58_00695, partial [Bacteroidales bacterium]|nr:hypothetical protein [Candidatus Cacconaster equi]
MIVSFFSAANIDKNQRFQAGWIKIKTPYYLYWQKRTWHHCLPYSILRSCFEMINFFSYESFSVFRA